MSALLCPTSASVPRSAVAKAFGCKAHPGDKEQTNKAYYPGSAYGGLRRFRQQITYRDLAGRPPFFRFDPIRLRANYDRRKSIEPIGA